MLAVLKQRHLEREQGLELARQFACQLKEKLGPLTALVCGSYARGDFHQGSDIDVLIISDDLPAHPLERASLLYSEVVGGIEPKGYTQAEFLRMLKKGNPLAVDALEEGVLLMDDGFWQQTCHGKECG